MSTSLPGEPRSYPQLVAAWASAIEPFADLAESLSPQQWSAASILPGWTNADIVAHVVGIERDLLGEPAPNLDLDWDALVHADDLFSRYTELAVAARRGVPQAEVCAELRAAIAARRQLLERQPADLGQVISGPGGWELPRGIVMRMRCFDIWVHDQDIRGGLGIPGDLDSFAAVVAARQMLSGLARSWAKSVKPESHQTARLVIEAPGLEFAVELLLDEEGRGRAVVQSDEDSPGHATTTLATSWSNFAAGCTGRVTFDPADVMITGDTDLADRLLASLNIAP
jgi:uncharacterized protein (TIGR03083 family)